MADELSGILDALRGSAERIGALVLDALPRGEFPMAVLEADDFPALLEHVRPRILYLVTEDFDLDQEFEDDLEGDGVLPTALDAIARRYRRHQGQCRTIYAAFMADGVLHYIVQTTDWCDRFEEEADQVREEITVAGRVAQAEADERLEIGLRERSRILAAHPAFTQGRPNIEKRFALAESLFEDLDAEGVRRVTSMADVVAWLLAHGLESSRGA